MLASLALVSADAETYVKLIIRHTWFLLPPHRGAATCNRLAASAPPTVTALPSAMDPLCRRESARRTMLIRLTLYCYRGCSIRSFYFLNLYLFQFPTEICVRFSSADTAQSTLKLQRHETGQAAVSRQPTPATCIAAPVNTRCARQTQFPFVIKCRIQFRNIVTRRAAMTITALSRCDT